MGIIAFLIMLAIFGISVAQRNLRDDQRRDAVRNIAAGITHYITIHQGFPDPSQVSFSPNQVSVLGGENIPLVGVAQAGSVTNGNQSAYCYSIAPGGYKLGVYLESNSWFNLGTATQGCSGTPPGGDSRFP